MTDLIKSLLEKFDRIIFDSPPAGSIVDASILASHIDGTILILQSGKVSKPQIKTVKAQLERVKANICGVVLNKVEIPKKYSYYYYQYFNKPKTTNFKPILNKAKNWITGDKNLST